MLLRITKIWWRATLSRKKTISLALSLFFASFWQIKFFVVDSDHTAAFRRVLVDYRELFSTVLFAMVRVCDHWQTNTLQIITDIGLIGHHYGDIFVIHCR